MLIDTHELTMHWSPDVEKQKEASTLYRFTPCEKSVGLDK